MELEKELVNMSVTLEGNLDSALTLSPQIDLLNHVRKL